MRPELEIQLEAALTAHFGEAISVSGLNRFHGGAARETYRFDADFGGRKQGFVVRRDPSASLIDTSRTVEFHILKRAHAAGLPAPEPVLLDPDGKQLGSPGFIMREVPGGHAPALSDLDPYGADAKRTGTVLMQALGRLHALVPTAEDQAVLPFQDAAGRLAHWKAEIERHRLRPEPIAMAGIRWLEAHMPPASGPLGFVHGDFRSGNFLVDANNDLLVILDWEMAHIGDPYEDLAWLMDPMWSHNDFERVAGTLPRAEAIAIWEEASGRRFDPALFQWWSLFSAVEGLAIWITSAHEIAHKRTLDPTMIFAGIVPYRTHNLLVAQMLQAFGAQDAATETAA